MTAKTLLITRPRGDAEALTEALRNIGMHAVHEPLMEIFLRHSERLALEKALFDEPDAILITSRHGVRALASLTELRDLALICVGEATAEAAESLGFLRVSATGGTANAMIDYVTQCYDEESRFLYLSGQQVRVDLSLALQEKGMQVERLAVYEAIPAEQLSDTVAEQLRRHQIDGVTLMSPRTAQIFMALLEKAGIAPAAAKLHVFALSEAVAAPLQALPWQGVHIAPEATLASMVESIDNTLKI